MRVAVIVLFFAACGTEREPPPPEPTRPAAPPEPAVPTVAELPPAGAGRASVAYPEWDPTTSRFDHPVRDLPARFARVDTVAHLVLGESAEHGVTVTLYGETIEARQYDVARLTEETAHDPGVVVVSVGEGAQGELRSTGGTLTLEAAGARDLRGTLDVRLQSRNVLHVSDREAIREQLRNRR
jgi:hypothetical protein